MLDRIVLVGGDTAVAAGDAADWSSAASAAPNDEIFATLLAERALLGPDDAETATDRLFALGVRALHAVGFVDTDERPTDVVEVLSECVDAEPGNLLYRLGLGYAYLQQEDWIAAVTQFDAAARSPSLSC